MSISPTTGTLPLVPPAPANDLEPDLDGAERRVVRPADLVSALTGVALAFYSLFVFAVTQWQYLGPDVDSVSTLGWLAPLLAGTLCVLAPAVSVGARLLARRPSERREVAE
ncbi:hypothetical protein Q0F99_01765 [Rathayibacter oskolensis]|uniref:hypothetical protein n=1 Tax=Rathayibacter oskolensis TaxID=1891671 RepID=UPI00265E9AFC|nr:hypothetical protein [Rathayibacter oskolensis]WKK71902.1 hypothetical protein Q0F99_01765 [Rathayibacter oskolensis]